MSQQLKEIYNYLVYMSTNILAALNQEIETYYTTTYNPFFIFFKFIADN